MFVPLVAQVNIKGRWRRGGDERTIGRAGHLPLAESAVSCAIIL